MVQLAIIVPAVGPQRELDETLVSVLENRPAACEVLVVHAPQYHDPYNLDDEVRFVGAADQNLANLLNRGIEAAEAPLVHILCPGMLVTERWTDRAVAHLNSSSDTDSVAVGVASTATPTRLRSLGIRWTAAGRVVEVARGKQLGQAGKHRPDAPSLAAGFYRREVFERTGGFNPLFSPYALDGEWVSRYVAQGGRCVALNDACVLDTSKRPVVRGLSAGWQSERAHWGRPKSGPGGSLLAHLSWVAWETLSHAPGPQTVSHLLGRGLGFLAAQLGRRPMAPELVWKTEPNEPTTLRWEDAVAARRQPRFVDDSIPRRAAG